MERWLTALYPDPVILSGDLRDRYFLPAPTDEPVFHYQGFSLAYQESTEQARWVAYELQVEHLNARKVSRTDYYQEDHAIPTGSATYHDYKNSGFTKGHLVPAADRAYALETMEETFLMSNMSPQQYGFNGGVWRELEEQTRDWARKNRSLIIVTGPVFTSKNIRYFGSNRVAVPEAFFKVILDHTEPGLKGIAFIVPNVISTRPLSEYVYSIDEVEQKTDLDFFYELFTNNLEDSLERQVDLAAWPFDENRFFIRINEWNKR